MSSKCFIHIFDEFVGPQSFLFTNFIHIFRRCSWLGKKKTVVFLNLRSLNNNSPRSTQNYRMYILTTLLCWYVSCFNQTCLISTTTFLWRPFMNTHSQKIHNKKQKILQGVNKCVLLFVNNVHIICIIHPDLISMVWLL